MELSSCDQKQALLTEFHQAEAFGKQGSEIEFSRTRDQKQSSTTQQLLNDSAASDASSAADAEPQLERFWALFLFGCCTCVNACGWISVAPVFLLVEDLYGVSPLMVNLMSYSFMALYLPMNFPCVYVVEKFGLRVGVIWGILSTTAGLWIRCLVNKSFYFALLGNTLMALGQPLLYNSPAKVTTNWFPDGERPMATMFGTQMNVFGIFIGFLLPSFFINDYSDSSQLTPASAPVYRRQIFNMLFALSIFATVISLLVILSFREKPNSDGICCCKKRNFEQFEVVPNSARPQLGLLEQMKLCLGNKEFVLSASGSCCVFIHLYVFSTLIGQLVAPFGMTDQQLVINLGLYLFGFGILGGVFFSMVLTCHPRQIMNSTVFISVAQLMCLALFFFADLKANETALLAVSSVLGFFLLPILFAAYELAVQQTQHLGVGDTMSCGLINIVANFAGFLLAIALTPALDKETESGAITTFIVLFANLALALILLLLGKLVSTKKLEDRND